MLTGMIDFTITWLFQNLVGWNILTMCPNDGFQARHPNTQPEMPIHENNAN